MNKNSLRWLFVIVGASLGLIIPCTHARAQTANAPIFAPTSCAEFDMHEHAPGAVEGVDMTCGYLTVPEFHDRPDDATIQLGVVIIHSTGDNPAPDPLLMAQGGPGGSGIELFGFLADPGVEPGQLLRAGRDLIAFEQRGALYSKPFLFCDEVYALDIDSMTNAIDDEQGGQFYVEAYAACRDRLMAAGVNLSAYDSEENARDIAALADALGYGQINFYGVSYGTMLGQHLMRLHPEVLRSVILDGVVALPISPNRQMGRANNRSFTLLFDACAADAACARHYPQLERIFFATVDELNREPGRVRIHDRETGVVYDARLTGDDLQDFVINLLYITDAIPLIPKFIYDVHGGDYGLYATMQTLLAFEKSDAEAMYFSVMCAEDFDYEPLDVDTTGVRPRLVDDLWADAALSLEICQLWDVDRLGPAADLPVVSDIPALLLSGHFDPVTPPAYADALAESLRSEYSYTFPAVGHGAFLANACANAIIAQFVDDPTREPDAASCMDTLSPPRFVTPDNTLMAPAITKLMTAIVFLFTDPGFTTPDARATLTDLALAYWPLWLTGAWLFFFPVVWFVGWVLARLRDRPQETHRAARLAPWLVLLLIGVIAIFGGALGRQLLSGGVFDLYAGIDRLHSWVFALPWLIALLTTLLLCVAALAWIKGLWGPVRRVYFTLTGLAALVYTVTLAGAGMFDVLLL